MSVPGAAVRLALPRDLGAVVWSAACVSLLIGAGAMVANKPLATPVIAAAFVAGVTFASWRAGTWILLVFLPFAGLPVFAITSSFSLVLKDLIIVLPLYFAFAAWVIVRGRRSRVGLHAFYPPVIFLSILVVAYIARSPNVLVGVIGAKVWLEYIPLLFVGYAFVREVADLERVLKATALLAIVPTALGLAEFALAERQGGFGPLAWIYHARPDLLTSSVYFGQSIPRIPSTFTTAAGFYNFELVALACALAIALRRRGGGWWVLVGLISLAALGSGVRRAYLTVPFVLITSALVARDRRIRALPRTALVLGSIVAVAAVATNVVGILMALPRGLRETYTASVNNELLPALRHGLIGSGTGSDTEAAIHHGGLGNLTFDWKEGWYSKASLELGTIGLAVALWLIATLIARGHRTVVSLSAPTRALAAPLWALLVVTALMLVKASEIDWDPLNAYFWLFGGMLLSLPDAAGATGGES